MEWIEWDMVVEIAKRAKEASFKIRKFSSREKDEALQIIVENLRREMDYILEENKKDIENAKGISSAMLDRLTLTPKRIDDMIKSVLEVKALKDPIGEIQGMWRRPNGLIVGRMRIPLGVIAVIYEARPNVTTDISALTIKSSNAVILRGGSEALNSNRALVRIIRDSLRTAGLPEDLVQLIEDTSRDRILELIRLEDYIDLVIPRGGEGLIRFVSENSRIPVLKHYKGVCHIFVDKYADLEKAYKICLNAKVQRPSVCNAMETLLVHKDIAKEFLPNMAKLYLEHGVELRGCERTREIIQAKPATEEDWYAEYLSLILAVRVVDSIYEAIEHIRKYGSNHTEAIITENWENAMLFLNEVDSSTVLVNASTRFSDGYEFGLGAEVGISTSKIHAYGPMGLEGLTTLKWIVFGNGQIRQ